MRLLLSALVGILLMGSAQGCASLHRSAHVEADSYSVIDPAYQGKKFSRILVMAKVGDLKLRTAIEAWCRSELEQLGVDAQASSRLLPATRQPTPGERSRLLKQHRIEAILEIVPTEQGLHERYLPPSYTTTSKVVEKKDSKGRTTYETVSETEQTGGGYTLRSPWMKFEAKLISVSSGENAWVSSSTATGNDLADQDDVIRSQAKDFVQKLASDGLLAPAPVTDARPSKQQLEEDLGIELGN